MEVREQWSVTLAKQDFTWRCELDEQGDLSGLLVSGGVRRGHGRFLKGKYMKTSKGLDWENSGMGINEVDAWGRLVRWQSAEGMG